MRRVISAMLCLLSLVAACAPATAPSQPAAPVTGGGAPAAATSGPAKAENQVVRVAQTGIPASLSPEVSSSNIPYFSAIFDPLITFQKDFKIVPQIATKWEFTNGGWRLTLRNDVKFSNGAPLTAEDVEFSLNLIATKNLPQKAYLPNLTGGKMVDATTVDVLSKGPDVSILNGLAWVFVLPKAYYNQVGDKEFQTKAIGSGPYEVGEYRASDLAVFKKKPSHPFRNVIATELRFQTVPETAAVVAGLRTGDIDATSHVTFAIDQVDAMKNSGVTISAIDGSYVAGVFSQPENREKNTPLTNRTVREALNYAMDKDAISKTLYKGLAAGTGQLTLTSSGMWDISVKAYPYDPKKAKELLAQAGYPNGFKLEVGLDFTPTSVNPQMLLAVQGFLKDVGVDAQINSYEIGTFLDKFYARNGQGKSEIFMFVSGDANGMGSSLRGNFNCDKKNFEVWWCQPGFDKLYDQAMTEPDTAKRNDLLKQAQKALLADVPALYLVTAPIFVASGAKIKNVEISTPLVYRFDDVYRTQ